MHTNRSTKSVEVIWTILDYSHLIHVRHTNGEPTAFTHEELYEVLGEKIRAYFSSTKTKTKSLTLGS